MKGKVALLLLSLAVFMAWGNAQEIVPVALKPGSESGPAVSTVLCPTFSWSSIEWAVGYRLAVFEAKTAQVTAYEKMAAAATPVLVKEIQGQALSWTPSAREQLRDGGRYVWYVEALDGSGQGVWSAGKVFEAADSAGDYIVAEYTTRKLSMITPGGVRTEIYTWQPVGTNHEYPLGVAIDGAGNYIVTTHDENYYSKLYSITPAGVATLIYSALNQAYLGVAVDGAGNYIVAESGTYPALSKITSSYVRTVIYNYYAIHGFLIYPQAVAIDGSGNYIVTESRAGACTLSKITPGGSRTVIYSFAPGQWPNYVAVDSAGNYIVTDYVDDTLAKITPGGVRTVIYDFQGGAQVEGVAVNSAGNYIVAESWAQKLSQITPGGARTVIYSFIYYTDPQGVAIVPGATVGYDATIWGWDYIQGWQIPVPITMDGVSTGYSTPHTFTGLTGTHTFTVPSTNSAGHLFSDWSTDWTDRTITVSEAGTYTARYRAGYSATIWSWCATEGWLSSPITMDGASTGFSTPYTFAGLNGTHTFTVPSTDPSGHAFYEWSTGSTARTLSVSSAGVYTARYRPATATLTVTAPNGGEQWARGTTRTITWSSAGSPGANVKIELLKAGAVVSTISSTTANDGSYSWAIPSSQTLGTDYRVRITSTSNTAITDSSNSNFAITVGSLTVTAPNGGEQWARGTTRTITWSSTGSPGANVKIELLKAGAVVRTISSSTANDGSYSWAIPASQTLGTDYRVRITSTSNTAITDSSNGNFSIT